MQTILGVTGHRPPKLGGYGLEARRLVERFAARALTSRPTPARVIVGMAQGWDMAVAQACDALGIPFVAAVPFHGQEGRWPAKQQDHYRYLLSRSVEEVYVSPGPYSPELMQIRNEWIVDYSTEIMALWDGSESGTGNCVAYAERVGKPWVNLWDDWTAYRAAPPPRSLKEVEPPFI